MSNYGRTIGKHVRRDLANAIRTFNAGDPRAVPPHRLDPAGLPTLERSDLLRLQEGLLDARNGTALIDGGFPQRFELNDYLALMMDFSWGRDWD